MFVIQEFSFGSYLFALCEHSCVEKWRNEITYSAVVSSKFLKVCVVLEVLHIERMLIWSHISMLIYVYDDSGNMFCLSQPLCPEIERIVVVVEDVDRVLISGKTVEGM